MGFFDPASPEKRQEDDLVEMVALLKEIRDLLKEQAERDKLQSQTQA